MVLHRKRTRKTNSRSKSLRKNSEQDIKNKNARSNNTTIPLDTEWSDIDDDENVFGTFSETDFCVETYNNCKKNVLYKIYREVIVENNDDSNSSKADSEDDWYTKDEIPKIEIIGSLRLTESALRSRNSLPRRQYLIIKEIIDTEETYIKNMKHIIDNYLQYFRKLEISPNIEKVFGNIEEIYEQAQRIYNQLQECVSVEEIANTFLENVDMFVYYTKYLRNKSNSHLQATKTFSKLIKARETELGEEFTFENNLLNPVQRPGRYKLLLENLEKAIRLNGEKCELLEKAIKFIDEEITKANTTMVIDCILYCPIDLRTKGSYLLKDTFNTKSKNKTEVVLFEKCVVFCRADEDNSNLYHYTEHIEIDKLTLRHSSDSMRFHLASFDIKDKTDKRQYEIELEAPVMIIKEQWINEIQRILWDQLQYYKDLQTKQNITRQSSKSSNENNRRSKSNPVAELRYCDISGDVYDENSRINGTFLDKHKNLRIEHSLSNSQEIRMANVPETQHILINDLINTERVYLEEIKSNIDNYQSYCERVNLPWYMLENIEDIYFSTQKLLSTFLECKSIDSLAKVFLDNINIFDSYKEYLWNRNTFCRYMNTKFENINFYLKNTQGLLKNEYPYNIHLLNPLERLEKYKQSLEELENELVKVGEVNQLLNNAVLQVNKKMGEIYTLITINSIRCCPINLRKMGLFIMKEAFRTKYNYNEVVFLFKDVIIFCVEDQNRPSTYIYEDSIQTRNLSVIYTNDSTSFKLRNVNHLDDDSKYTNSIETSSILIKEKWINAIKTVLWGHPEFYKGTETDSNKSSGNKDNPKSNYNNAETKKRWKLKKSKSDINRSYTRFYSNI